MQTDKLLDYIHNIFSVKQCVEEAVGAANGLSSLDVHMLTFFKIHANDTTATDIERKHRIKKNTISVHVDNLVRQGYLCRQDNADDRRKVILVLTPKGEEIAQQCFEKFAQAGHELREGLSDEDVAMLHRCMAVVNDNALGILAKRRKCCGGCNEKKD